MSDNIVSLSEKRAPIWYTLRIGHHWDDRLEVIVEDVSDDARSQASVNDAISRIAASRMNAAHIHAALLARIDQLMGADAGTPESQELSVLADACVVLEKWLFP